MLDIYALIDISTYMKQCYEKFKALGEETRFRIVAILARSRKELCACEIIDCLEKAQYTISKSMSVLTGCGIINERREGKMMFYSLNTNDKQVKSLIEAVKIISESSCGNPNDFEKLEKRLAQRENGKCTKGCG